LPIAFKRITGWLGTSNLQEFTEKTLHHPLWCAGEWYGPGHIVVLTGTDGSEVYINDPDGGLVKTGSISWFNAKIHYFVPGCIMCKDPQRY